MILADELLKVEQMHQRGALTDDEFLGAKARLLHVQAPDKTATTAINSFRRSGSDRWLAGLCGGLGVATGIDAWFWRLLFTVLCFMGGTGLVVYILFWIFVPSE